MKKAEQKDGSKEKLSELKCDEWWYQWPRQALLIKAERSVVLAWFTRVLARDHYERIDQISPVRGERRVVPLLSSTTVGQGSNKSAEKGYKETWVTIDVVHGRARSTRPQCRPNYVTSTSRPCRLRHA